jgi:pimeloyl-ACP methyl ester carboxylesterase
MRRLLLVSAALVLAATAAPLPTATAQSRPQIGTTFPEGFAVPVDASLDAPVLGFGSADGEVVRTPVIFLHGNNDTPYPTRCNEDFGKIRDFAQSFLDAGWSPKELWALGYQGDQCDLQSDQTRRAGVAHTTVANVPDLRAFVRSVLDYTGATQVDIIGHSLGTTVAREWMRQDDAYGVVRRLVGVDGPNHGIINCSPSPLNYYAAAGFTPDSPVCLEYGAADTPLLTALNSGDETPGPTEYLMAVNADTSFVYFSKLDGIFAPVPAEDREGRPHDFSRSAQLEGATIAEFTGQGRYDDVLFAAHTGIVNSPEVWKASAEFLVPAPAAAQPGPSQPGPARPAPPEPATHGDPVAALAGGTSSPGTATPRARTLAATGSPAPVLAAGAVLLLAAAGVRRRLS